MVMPLSVEELTQRADKIFVGTCIQAERGVNAQGMPVLTITFAVAESLKGVTGETVTFQQLDPTPQPSPNPHIRSHWSNAALVGLPTYTPGENVLLFLAKPGKFGLTSPIGLQQGKWPITVGSTGKKSITNRALRPTTLSNNALPAPGKAAHYQKSVAAVRVLAQPQQ